MSVIVNSFKIMILVILNVHKTLEKEKQGCLITSSEQNILIWYKHSLDLYANYALISLLVDSAGEIDFISTIKMTSSDRFGAIGLLYFLVLHFNFFSCWIVVLLIIYFVRWFKHQATFKIIIVFFYRFSAWWPRSPRGRLFCFRL